MRLFELAIVANEPAEAHEIIAKIKQREGEQGNLWRFAEAACLIDQAGRGDTRDLRDSARKLVAEIGERRPDWWGGPLLKAQVAEFENQPEEALAEFHTRRRDGESLAPRCPACLRSARTIGRISRRPIAWRRLLTDRGVASRDVTIFGALKAIRIGDIESGLRLARQVSLETSNLYSDHLSMGRVHLVAGRMDEAGKDFRRAVELGPGLPATWLAYVEYLVQSKQLVQARAVIEQAGKALPAESVRT